MDKKNRLRPNTFNAQETQRLILPIAIASIIFFSVMIYIGIEQTLSDQPAASIVLGVTGIIYSIALFYWILPYTGRLGWSKWVVLITNTAIFALGLEFLPSRISILPHIILVLLAILTILTWGRQMTYMLIGLASLAHIFLSWNDIASTGGELEHLVMLAFVIVISETIYRLTQATQERIHRLEILNVFSRTVASSIEVDQVMTLLSAAIQDAIEADTYFVGILDGENIKVDLVYDDGEFFPPMEVPLKGTLSGWIIRHNEPLFIPDLRDDLVLDGVDVILVGNDRSNLCWMGVPMTTAEIRGMIVAASYTTYAFDRTDLELLESLGQQAALALNNAYHHTEVERQSHLDSLTEVYNHGHFLRQLEKQASDARTSNRSLSLIMLDIDFFKQYNDSYGHLTGDRVLIELVATIRSHIHVSDLIGRWGGEEFAVCLPETTGEQATLVAQRIQKTMMELKLSHPEKGTIPAPTVSQGIAVFPIEADDIYKMVDLADQRLYVAKERGRNQIEPPISHWKKIKT